MNDVTEFVVYIRPAHFVYIRAWGLMGRSRDNIWPPGTLNHQIYNFH